MSRDDIARQELGWALLQAEPSPIRTPVLTAPSVIASRKRGVRKPRRSARLLNTVPK